MNIFLSNAVVHEKNNMYELNTSVGGMNDSKQEWDKCCGKEKINAVYTRMKEVVKSNVWEEQTKFRY